MVCQKPKLGAQKERGSTSSVDGESLTLRIPGQQTYSPVRYTSVDILDVTSLSHSASSGQRRVTASSDANSGLKVTTAFTRKGIVQSGLSKAGFTGMTKTIEIVTQKKELFLMDAIIEIHSSDSAVVTMGATETPLHFPLQLHFIFFVMVDTVRRCLE